ncbi:glycosyltransferase family 2 protein [Nakamurella leprariae]|uniref:Glycosyltransferase family 2 protein n=1 Tax=Nakamurella leprariae TaxID=2803911 RepID=A0A939C124_9ACTN|nr:glycosyltransferase family 2 protein [Nakamurella leprariae]MBM9466737.1 glycosyltransferase family 2 protein [Nakamurella leprariae]
MHAVRPRPEAAPKISIVVPARNEARNLEVVLPALPSGAEIIVVDGHSVDDSAEVVRRVRPDARFVGQTRKGKGNALAVGFAEATGDIIVMFDADGSADVAEIDRFVEALLAGADFAKGSRVLAGGGSTDITVIRSLGNRGLTLLTNVVFRTRYTDLCYGYNAFWSDVLPHLDLPLPHPTDTPQWGDGFEIETMINTRVATARLRVAEVPSIEQDRLFGESNLHAVRDGLRVLRTIVTERWRTLPGRSRRRALELPVGQSNVRSLRWGRRAARPVPTAAVVEEASA